MILLPSPTNLAAYRALPRSSGQLYQARSAAGLHLVFNG